MALSRKRKYERKIDIYLSKLIKDKKLDIKIEEILKKKKKDD